MFHKVVYRDTIQVRWERFTLFCGKFTQDTIQQILPESTKFCRRYHKKKTFWLNFFSDTVYTAVGPQGYA